VASLTFVSDGHLSHGHLSPMHLSSQHLSLQHIERITAAFIAWQQPDKLKTHMAARAGRMVFHYVSIMGFSRPQSQVASENRAAGIWGSLAMILRLLAGSAYGKRHPANRWSEWCLVC